jgi:aryl-alcohol dehydrogenase-like predicted oxidoreductase
MPTAARATRAGTARFHARIAADVAADHVRPLDELSLSSVGLGTYLGATDDDADRRYQAAIARALALGVNVVDCAINYRAQRSERAAGAAVAAAAAAGIARDELVVATKGGFLPFDGERPADARAYLTRTYLDSGLAPPDEIACGCHCIAPAYLDDQIARSLANLGLETIDVYYLHNPETQLEEVDPTTFRARLRSAFETLERAADDGRIGCYGCATWDGFRVPAEAPVHLELADLVGLAREVGGDGHRFRVVQLPVNRRMTEAAEARTQGSGRQTLLDAALALGVYVMSSASILQGKLAADAGAARAAIDWVRTRPGLGTALVGMGRPEHVDADVAAFRRT